MKPWIHRKTAQKLKKMLVCEAHDRYIQGLISRTNGWNIIAFRNFVENYGHIGFTDSYAIERLEFSV
jgi:hypothetical protein